MGIAGEELRVALTATPLQLDYVCPASLSRAVVKSFSAVHKIGIDLHEYENHQVMEKAAKLIMTSIAAFMPMRVLPLSSVGAVLVLP
ncbi:hypothetical protein [Arthrobacter sp. MYb222]|uniref:hypothetical protein n=1 Tax=Arthrobacter sp. MYb222 TaxID=1848599 RepID=UPI0011B0DA91|nr:hypothetical protein [Arthrobacter sp. MYb222]